MLFVAAAPAHDINTDTEFRRVRRVLDAVAGIELVPLLCASIDDLQWALIDGAFDYVHFAAHGTTDHLSLQSAAETGPQRADVPIDQVIELLELHRTLSCVVLNVCDAAAWATRLRGPALVAMKGSIEDEVALRFSETFYRAVAAGQSSVVAFEQARVRARRSATADFEPRYWPDCTGVIGVHVNRGHRAHEYIRAQMVCDLRRFFPCEGEQDWAGASDELARCLDLARLRQTLAPPPWSIDLDCPMSLAFLSGRLLGSSGDTHAYDSRIPRRLWKPDHRAPMPEKSPWEVTESRSIGARTLAVSISVSVDTRPLVEAHFEAREQPVDWVDFRPVEGPRIHAVRDAAHAHALARTLAQELPGLRRRSGCESIELFCAAPNPFMFLLGQQGACLGKLNLHEKVRGEDRYERSFPCQ